MEEFIEVNLNSTGEVIVERVDKILLIDADTIAYTACLAAEVEEQLLPRDMYTDEEWEETLGQGFFDIDTHTLYYTLIEESLRLAEDKLRRIRDNTGSRIIELHFTTGKSSFRYLINPEYKANRKSRTPQGLGELKRKLLEIYNGNMWERIEADDAVIAFYDPEIHVLTAVDKDVIYSVAGTHFNYYESGVYNIQMKWVEVDELTAMKHPYHQTLTGDTTDNIISPRGIGKKTADKILAKCTTPGECWIATVSAYKKKGWTEDQAIQVMRQVNLHQYKDGRLNLWSSPKSH